MKGDPFEQYLATQYRFSNPEGSEQKFRRISETSSVSPDDYIQSAKISVRRDGENSTYYPIIFEIVILILKISIVLTPHQNFSLTLFYSKPCI